MKMLKVYDDQSIVFAWLSQALRVSSRSSKVRVKAGMRVREVQLLAVCVIVTLCVSIDLVAFGTHFVFKCTNHFGLFSVETCDEIINYPSLCLSVIEKFNVSILNSKL